MARLYELLQKCNEEEEVKSEFAKFFKFKITANKKHIDHYSEEILFEFKYDKNFHNIEQLSKVMAQSLYYIRWLTYNQEKDPVPPYICLINKTSGVFFETKKYIRTYKADRYDWDRAPSSPDPKLVKSISKNANTKKIHIYDFNIEEEEKNFISKYKQCKIRQLELFASNKKIINADNFVSVFDYWNGLFGDCVKNGLQPSTYFLSDITDKTNEVNTAGLIRFILEDNTVKEKQLPLNEYKYFWSLYEKVKKPNILHQIMQMKDRISEDITRRFTGEFYTPIEFAQIGWKYLEKVIGKEWWKEGKYRIWDMASGTGNLEYKIPTEALQYCYISSLNKSDVEYCERIFPTATCFQYDYLNDDVALLFDNTLFEQGIDWKLPDNLRNDLQKPDIKWVIFINPPFGTSNNKKKDTTKKQDKQNISFTKIQKRMAKEDLGEVSRELFTQFLYRISKEFENKTTYLGLFSKISYLNANNDQKLRDGFFQYKFESGFMMPASCFGAKDWPISFIIWNLTENKHINDQNIKLDVFNEMYEKIGIKKILPIGNKKDLLNKWVKRYKNTKILPAFSSPFKLADKNKDIRDKVTDNFICSLSSNGDDFQHQNDVQILSGPYCSAGAFSVTPDNFEDSMVLFASKLLPKKTWINDRNLFYKPNSILSQEFKTDCVIWGLLSDSNNTIAWNKLKYINTEYNLPNNLFPFLLEDVNTWDCQIKSIKDQIQTANQDRFLAEYINHQTLSKESSNCLEEAKKLYKYCYNNLHILEWNKWKVYSWDIGFYQVRNLLNSSQLSLLKKYHKELGIKLLKQLYSYGILQEDFEEFE